MVKKLKPLKFFKYFQHMVEKETRLFVKCLISIREENSNQMSSMISANKIASRGN